MDISFTFPVIFLASLILTALIIPPVIRTAFKKNLFDHPTESRKIHTKVVPNLGGIAIFAGFMFCQQLFIQSDMIPALNQVLMSGTILFMVGLKDDIVGLSPYKKFVAQFCAALVLAVIGDIRIFNLQELFGFSELSYVFSVTLTIFAIVGIVNAFNLIDGIDGLAGVIGLIIFLSYSYFFYYAGATGWSYLCLALSGALVGFLLYNRAPAAVFMGDSGSLFIGFFAAVTTIQLLNTVTASPIHTPVGDILSATGLAMAALIVPLFDTLRVFILRILDNKSPFEADRNHIHHRLLHAGLSHNKITGLLGGITIAFVLTAFLLQDVSANQVIATLSIIILSLNTGFTLYINGARSKSDVTAGNMDVVKDEADLSKDLPDDKKEYPERILRKIFSN